MTLSLVGCCARTGMLGAIVMSSSPAVAARCAWGRARVGAACSQNITDPALGPALLDRISAGAPAPDALAAITSAVKDIEYRQLTVVDAFGRAASFSGGRTLGRHADVTGTDCAAAGNLLAARAAPAEMARAFESDPAADLGDRLLAALAAGRDAGGEEGDVHSAGMVVYDDVAWPVTDLRVDWTLADPVADLTALWDLWRPLAADYVTRARDPGSAPSYGVPGDRSPHAHPLDPLTAGEVARAVALATAAPGLSDRLRVVSVELREPVKSDYLEWKANGGTLAREAFCVLLDSGRRRGVEAVVSLDDDRLVSAADLPEGVQPAVHGDEFAAVADAVRADPRYVEAVRARGVDPADVHIEPWSSGTFEPGPGRVARAISWVRRDDDGDNPYSRPLYGLVAAVDLDDLRVLRVEDHGPGTPPPTGEGGDYRDGGGRPYRTDLRPIEITQPEGPSFVLDGHHLAWQRWDLRIGFHPREGLVLHDIGYEDGGERRSICHRASIAELVIPYGDPNPTTHFKNVFDIGEYGLAPLTNSLRLGCDCLGEIAYLDGVTNHWSGEPYTIANAICIHEEDANLLWKHTDDHSGRVDRARSRRLVISSIVTVGNYEYGFFWYLYQDASIEFEAKLTGILHTAGNVSAERSPHSLPLGDGIVTSHHQHFFCARLDLDIDGTANVACDVEAACDPWGPGNPDGSAFRPARLTYERESMARRDLSPETARRFRVENRSRRNRIGDPVAYELVPGDSVRPMQQPDSQVRERARFLDHNVWVTPYRPDERYPAGEYPNQSPGGEGLGRWTEADRNLIDEDVVLWYVFGAHHFPRLEDWPVMPVVRCGFQLRPVGFFDRNPALDVPPPHAAHACAPPR